MGRRDANLNIPITSTFDGRGFKDAKSSATAMEREFAKLEREAEKQAQAVERVNQAQRDAMTSTGKWVLGISAASAAGLAMTAKAAMDWESAWAGVLKTVDGTDSQLNALEGDLRRMARSMPATHTEIAAVAEAAGQLGVATQDVATFSRTMLQLGTATNMTSDEAATALAQLSNIMGTSTADVSRMGATIVALGNNSATTERSIVQMAQRMAGSAKTIGLTEAQTLSLAAALSSVGIEVEAGGTAISRVMTDIAKAVDLGGDDLAGFAEVAGVSAADFAAAFREDPADAIITFVEGLGRIDAAGGSVFSTLEELGMSDVRVSRALLSMSGSGDLLRSSLELGNQAWEENIALVEEANKRYETTESKLQIARNQIQDAAIDIGGTFLPAVAGAAEAVGSMAVGFGSLPEPVQKFVTWLGAGATGLGTLGGAALIAVPKIHEFKKTLDALQGGASVFGKALGGAATVLTGPWGLAIAGAVAVLGIWLKIQGDSKKAIDETTAALDQQTGAVTQQNRELTYNRLLQDGIIDKAEKLGIGLADLVDAALDPASEGYARLAEMVKTADDALNAARTDGSVDALNAHRVANEDLYEVLKAVGVEQERVGKGQEELARRQEAGLVVTDEVTTATDAAADAQAGLSDELDETGISADDVAEALKALEQAINDLNNPTLNLSDAQISWQQTLAEVNKQLEENGKSLDINTEKGRANQSFLNDMARDAINLAQALLTESGSEVEFRANLEQSREALRRTAEQFGMTEDEARAYVDQVLQIPTAAYTEIDADAGDALVALNGLLVELDGATGTVSINGEDADAQKTLGELIGNVDEATGTVEINGQSVPAEITLQDLLDLIDGSKAAADILGDDAQGRDLLRRFIAAVAESSASITVGADTSQALAAAREARAAIEAQTAYLYVKPRTIGSPTLSAFGYADGGIRESHVAQIAPAGAWRLWAEPETGGEAYIPLSPAKRARSEEVLGDVAHRFGMYVGRYADGAVLASSGSGSRRETAPVPVPVPSHFTLIDADGALIGTLRGIATDTAAEWVDS